MEQRVVAPMAAGVVTVDVAAGDALQAGQLLCVLEAMKMEHELRAPAAGRVLRVGVFAGQSVEAGEVLIAWDDRPSISLAPADAATPARAASPAPAVRPDLQALLERQAWTRDAARPEAVARRRARGQRTARENVDALCDPGSCCGAIDADAADKAVRFMALCNAHGLPLVSLIDTPGFMVGRYPRVADRRAGRRGIGTAPQRTLKAGPGVPAIGTCRHRLTADQTGSTMCDGASGQWRATSVGWAAS